MDISGIVPDASVYAEEAAQAQHAYELAINNISQRRATTLQSYGFTAQVDPSTGQLQHYAIDPNNPYGQVQTLMTNEGTQLDSIRNADAARGIGTIGLGAQNQDRYRFIMGGEQGALGQGFTGAMGQLSSDQLTAKQSYDAALVQAQRDAIMAAIMEGMFGGYGGGGGGGGPAPAGTSPGGNYGTQYGGPYYQNGRVTAGQPIARPGRPVYG